MHANNNTVTVLLLCLWTSICIDQYLDQSMGKYVTSLQTSLQHTHCIQQALTSYLNKLITTNSIPIHLNLLLVVLYKHTFPFLYGYSSLTFRN